MIKRSILFFMAFVIGTAFMYYIPPTSQAEASQKVGLGKVKVTLLTKNTDNSFYVNYEILQDLESFESISVVGNFSPVYRGAFNGVGVKLNTKKGKYVDKIAAPNAGHGWLSFSVKYVASGGRGYEQSQYLDTKLVAAPNSTTFKTVTKAEAALSYYAFTFGPGLAMTIYSNSTNPVKVTVGAAYAAFVYLTGYQATINEPIVQFPVAGNYIKTSVSTSSSGTVTTSIQVYTNKESYDKGVSPIDSYSRSYEYPR